MRDVKLEALKTAYGRIKIAADNINVYCHCPSPRCPTSTNRDKIKLVIRIDDGRYHCWVCGIKGRNIADLTRRFVRRHGDIVAHAFPSRRPTFDEPQPQQREVVEVPQGMRLLATHVDDANRGVQAMLRYLYSRGMSDVDLWRYRLCFSHEKQFRNRVIIPSFDADGKMNYYVTRTIDPRVYPRYVNAPVKRQEVIFNEIDIDWHSELVITEGPFDAMNCGGNVTCLLGNSMDTKFGLFRKIVEHATPIVLALDAEEVENTRKLAHLLYSYDINVRIMDVSGHKDLGSMPREVIHERLDDAKLWTPQSSLMNKISRINDQTVSGSLDSFLNI